MRIAALALSLAVLLPAPASAQCDGTPGFDLDAPDFVGLGETVDLKMTGPLNEMALLMVSLGDGPVQSAYGTLCVDFPLVLALPFTLDGNGQAAISGVVPCDPILIDLTLYLQFITCRPAKGASDMESITFTDAFHPGSFCTFTQGGWGANCSGENPGCLLEDEFANVFPNGILIGDQDGVADGDAVWAACWGSAAALNAFLPIGGSPGALTKDDVDATIVSACVFAGQLVAAKLNVGFDDAGTFDDGKCRDDLKLGDLVFVAGVDSDLIGWSVRELIELCDLAISGALGNGPFDLDGDGKGDVKFSHLNDALDAVNRNFADCTTNLGYLDAP